MQKVREGRLQRTSQEGSFDGGAFVRENPASKINMQLSPLP